MVNPLVPVSTAHRAVPTGHGVRESVRDKGLLWVFNQSMRVGAHARLHQEVARMRAAGKMQVLVLEPEPTDVLLFLHNPVNFETRARHPGVRVPDDARAHRGWMEREPRDVVERFGWRAA